MFVKEFPLVDGFVQLNRKILSSGNKVMPYAVAPPGTFIGGGAKNVGVWGGAQENFSFTTPSTLAINVTNAPFIGWDQDK